MIMLITDRSAQAELGLFGLLKATAFSNVMRQDFEDQEKGKEHWRKGSPRGGGQPRETALVKSYFVRGHTRLWPGKEDSVPKYGKTQFENFPAAHSCFPSWE